MIVLEGEIEATFRGEKSTVHTGQTVSIPAIAGVNFYFLPPPFYFASLPTRRSTPPALDQKEQAELKKKTQELVAKYRTEMLKP